MSHPPPNPGSHLYEIELVLQHLAAAPDDVALHRRLRGAGLRYRADGGRGPGALERVRPAPTDPVARLLHAERLWAMDPADPTLLSPVVAALAALQRADPARRDFAPVRRWLYDLTDLGPAGE